MLVKLFFFLQFIPLDPAPDPRTQINADPTGSASLDKRYVHINGKYVTLFIFSREGCVPPDPRGGGGDEKIYRKRQQMATCKQYSRGKNINGVEARDEDPTFFSTDPDPA